MTNESCDYGSRRIIHACAARAAATISATAGTRLHETMFSSNRAEERKRFLQHQPDVAPVVGHGKAPDVNAVRYGYAVRVTS
jgi:hypothetical protein